MENGRFLKRLNMLSSIWVLLFLCEEDIRIFNEYRY